MSLPFPLRSLTSAFTLVEVLLSTAIIGLLMIVLLTMTDQTSQTWRRTTGKIEQFQQARTGFESMTRRLNQATLNTYWDVTTKKVGAVDVPDKYIRQSELRFVSGPMKDLATGSNMPTHGVFFQAPLGFVDDTGKYAAMDNLLNTWGYFLEVGDDKDIIPTFLQKSVPPRWRSRLMELMQPSERMSVYLLTGKETGPAALAWFRGALTANPRPVRVLAENIMALVVLPQLAKTEETVRTAAGKSPLAPKYSYDSTKTNNTGAPAGDAEINPKNQLPPVVQVTMVAIDEASATRLAERFPASSTLGLTTAPLFLDSKKLEDDSGTATPGDGDLATLEKQLVDLRLNYRVFTSSVSIRGAKWSKSQKN